MEKRDVYPFRHLFPFGAGVKIERIVGFWEDLRHAVREYAEDRGDLDAVRDLLEDNVQMVADHRKSHPHIGAFNGAAWCLLAEHDNGDRSAQSLRKELLALLDEG